MNIITNNFSSWKARCSGLSKIMKTGVGKTNLEKYEEAVIKHATLKEKTTIAREKLLAIDEVRAPKGYSKQQDFLFAADERESKQKKLVEDLYKIKDIKTLSESAKTFLCDIYVSVKYGMRTEIKSKYLEKGNMMEEDAITLYSNLVGEFFVKNKERKSNEWIEGECDFPFERIRCIHDTKVSWDIFTFYRNLSKEDLVDEYDWQGQGYMWLWDYEKHKVIYTLLSTPPKLIRNEKDRLFKTWLGTQEEYEAACIELERKMTYEHIPPEERCIVFEIDRDENKIELIKEKVALAREFLYEIYLNKRLFKNIIQL